MTPRLSAAANVQILQTYLQIGVCCSPNELLLTLTVAEGDERPHGTETNIPAEK